MNLTPMALAIARAFGRQPLNIASAAWLWFEWSRDARGNPVSYRWRI